MKKLLCLVPLIALLAGSVANAADYRVQSFITPDVSSLIVSNTLQLTNLASFSASYPTNVSGLIYTNYTGTQVVVGSASYKNLCVDVDLWPFQGGSGPLLLSTNTIAASSQNIAYTKCGIYTRLVGQSGANSAVNFVFEPVPDGDNNNPGASEANCITVAVTATTTTEVRTWTPIDLANNKAFIGVKKIRLRRINNADTDATSNVAILECALCGVVQ